MILLNFLCDCGYSVTLIVLVRSGRGDHFNIWCCHTYCVNCLNQVIEYT